MNILFDINHPADVHFFKHTIFKLKNEHHHIQMTARDKDVTLRLLKNYKLEFETLSRACSGTVKLFFELLERNLKLIPIIKKNKIRLSVSFTGASTSQVGKLLGVPSLVFYDTEGAKIQNKITYPFATEIFTPWCYKDDLGPKHTRFNAVKELAYLHPNYFTPDKSALSSLGLKENDKFVIIRTVAWQAAHDVGQSGISGELMRQLIDTLSPHAKIFIVAESNVAEDIGDYLINIPPEKIHDILYYADLYIGEGATMASECACLGTPSIYLNSQRPGYILEESEKYELVFPLTDRCDIIKKALSILKTNDKEHWQKQRQRFIADQIDLTQWMTEKILRYA